MISKYTVRLVILSLLLPMSASASVELILYKSDLIDFEQRINPGDETTYTYGIFASGPVDARFVHPLPRGAAFRVNDPRWNCTQSDTALTCTRHLTNVVTGPPELELTVIAPRDSNGSVTVGKVRLESDELGPSATRTIDLRLFVYRTFQVTTADDFGSGSLRAVIDDANDRCGTDTPPCKITFADAMRIAPASPLPAITACDLLIDGGGYVRKFPNRSFDAPRRVEISGENAGAGNGFTIRSGCLHNTDAALQGLAINSFLGNGVSIEAPAGRIVLQGCSIGTDAAGVAALPNVRGISIDAPDSFVTITDCLIAGNARSGVFWWHGQGGLVSGNLIGVRFGGAPLPNGASGIYTNTGDVRLDNNAIEYNHDFGVAVGPGAVHFNSQYDFITFNGGIAVDWGLDGPTNAAANRRMPPVPVLLDAFYDAAHDQTVVTGVLPEGDDSFFHHVNVFAGGSGDYQGGLFKASLIVGGGSGPFTITFRGRYTGQNITAQTERWPFPDFESVDTSELSAAIVAR